MKCGIYCNSGFINNPIQQDTNSHYLCMFLQLPTLSPDHTHPEPVASNAVQETMITTADLV